MDLECLVSEDGDIPAIASYTPSTPQHDLVVPFMGSFKGSFIPASRGHGQMVVSMNWSSLVGGVLFIRASLSAMF